MHPCLFLDLSVKTSFLTIKYDICCKLFVDIIYRSWKFIKYGNVCNIGELYFEVLKKEGLEEVGKQGIQE